eukprot:TRINITY_DN75530_c0_g1_i1.p1 TRINITY_DN75530_c0_g1~~TRINITY_DN75530_c0_g1_i1.p1  ORF type:complete len:251 (+),score=36.65 TRINITY_DN75530_c0_g1_i1:76-828(+)
MTDGPQLKRSRSEPDMKVITDDGEVMVHSLILMLASPVFDKMLSSSMKEGSEQEIRLPGKIEQEFSLFYKSLQLHTMVPLTKDSALFLCKWADEYQIEALKGKCEEFLISSVPVDGPSLKHAVTYGLKRRTRQCIARMVQDVENHMDDFRLLAEAGLEDCLKAVWPFICTSAGVSTFTMPQVDMVKNMWPFLVASVRSHKSAKSYERLVADMKGWPQDAFLSLPATGKADEKARNFIGAKLRSHGIQPNT